MRHQHSSSRPGRHSQPQRNQRSARSGWKILRWLAPLALVFAAVLAYGFQDSPALHAVTRPNPHPRSNSAPTHQEASSPVQSSDSVQNSEDYKPLIEELTRLHEKLVQG